MDFSWKYTGIRVTSWLNLASPLLLPQQLCDHTPSMCVYVSGPPDPLPSPDSCLPNDPDPDPGDASPPLIKQRANTESLESSHSEGPNKYNTPLKGRSRPVPPKKQPAGTPKGNNPFMIPFKIYILVCAHYLCQDIHLKKKKNPMTTWTKN